MLLVLGGLQHQAFAGGTSEVALQDARVQEGNDTAGGVELSLPVIRTGDLGTALRLTVTATPEGAVPGQDYDIPASFVEFLPGQTEVRLTLRVRGDLVHEAPEKLRLRLSQPETTELPLAFDPPAPLSSGDSPTGVVLADLDRDGAADLVVANWEAGTVGIRYNRGRPGAGAVDMSEATVITIGGEPRAVTVADYNRDGWNDLAVADRAGHRIVFLLNEAAAGGGRRFIDAGTQAVAKDPISLDSADFDGDGLVDVAVALRDSDDAVVLRNTGVGAGTVPIFTEVARIAAQDIPRNLKIADVNRDGRPDLLVANRASSSVSVILNATTVSGEPLFQPAIHVPSGNGAIAVLAEDLNRDGLMDLVTANWRGNNLSVLLGLPAAVVGDVRFAAPRSVPVGMSPRHVVAYDLDGDGRKDLVAANRDSDDVSIVVNRMEQAATVVSFARENRIAAGDGAFFLAVADLDSDGAADIVSADYDGGTVSVLRQQSKAVSGPVVLADAFEAAGAGTTALAEADFNGDGRLDVVAADLDQRRLSLWLGAVSNGGRSILVQQTIPSAAGSPTALAVADFDGDGRSDFAVAEAGPDALTVYLNRPDGSGLRWVPGSLGLSAAPKSVLAGDIDADGRSDLVVVQHNARRVLLLRNVAARGAAQPDLVETDSLLLGFVPAAASLVDMDRDGLQDLAVVDGTGARVVILRNDSREAGFPHFTGGSVFPAGTQPGAVGTGDFNLDGRQDLAFVDGEGQALVILLNQTALDTGISLAPATVLPMVCRPAALLLRRGDFNADGRDDLLGLCADSGRPVLLRNITEPGSEVPRFSESRRHRSGGGLSVITSGDFNADGRIDAVALADSGAILLLTNAQLVFEQREAVITIDDDDAPGISPPAVPGLSGSQGSGGGAFGGLALAVPALLAMRRRRNLGRPSR
ncbi:MAG TPA: VCBS repeat-containing protein [Solimonas sp.]|nr:VCBS repeat-containing protein [Solimonas sp.]